MSLLMMSRQLSQSFVLRNNDPVDEDTWTKRAMEAAIVEEHDQEEVGRKGRGDREDLG